MFDDPTGAVAVVPKAATMTLGELRQQVVAFAGAFDADLLDPGDLKRALEHASRIENCGAVMKALVAVRLADTERWRNEGFNDPADQMARLTGSSVTRSREAIAAGRRLRELEATSEAAKSGALSIDQTAAIADAATADRAAERRLLEKASNKQTSLRELNDECASVKAATEDLEERDRRIHRARSLRSRTDRDGTFHLAFNNTVTAGAIVMDAINEVADQLFAKARAEGRREPVEAYSADALTAICAAHRANRVFISADSGAGTSASRSNGQPAGGGTAGGPAGPTGAAGSTESTGGAGPCPHNTAEPAGADKPNDTATLPGSEPPDGTAEPGDGRPNDDQSATSPAGRREPAPPTLFPSHPVADRPLPEVPPGVRMPNRGGWRDAKIIFLVSLDAYRRGHPVPGETVEIAGHGPVPVSVVEEALASGDPFVAAVLFNGRDVATVAHVGRRPTSYQLTALQAMGIRCAGCGTRHNLQIHHVDPWHDTKTTRLDKLRFLCGHRCHPLVSDEGWDLTPDDHLMPPADPRHPKRKPRPAA